jgi:hypothetical protein
MHPLNLSSTQTKEQIMEQRIAFVNQPSSGEIVVVKEGEKGYYETLEPMTQDHADVLNERLGVDEQMKQAMLVGSMFGWDVPGALPEIYNWIKVNLH